MKMRIIAVLAFALFFFVSSARAQTVAELETKYGAPVKSYSVSENIWMSPEFTADGQLCMARLYPKKIDATTNYLSSMLTLWEVEDVFNELAPAAARGKRKEDYGARFTGSMIFYGFGYENVSINFVSPLSSSATPANKRRAEEVAEFPGVRSAQIVTIIWLNRQCVAR